MATGENQKSEVRDQRSEELARAISGKASALRDRHCLFVRDFPCPAIGRINHADNGFSFWCASRKRTPRLRALSRKTFLAARSRSALSVLALDRCARALLGGGANGGDQFCCHQNCTSTGLFVHRVVLVPDHARAGDRSRAGRPAGDG